MSSKKSPRPPYRPPSPVRPLWRRLFINERARDQHDTIALYNRVRCAFQASPWSHPDAIATTADLILAELDPPAPIRAPFRDCLNRILATDTPIFAFPDANPESHALNVEEQFTLRHFLRAKQRFLANDHARAEPLITTLVALLRELLLSLPSLPADSEGFPFSTPLLSLIAEPARITEHIIATLSSRKLADNDLFVDLQRTLYENICRVSGIEPDTDSGKRLVLPRDAKLDPSDIPATYLANTPFLTLLLSPVPFAIALDTRFEHMHVVGGAGHGKTQTLQHLIATDLSQPDPPSLIIIDSHGDMLAAIERLDVFDPTHGRLTNRLIIIDPEDVEHPPALNMFDMGSSRLATYTAAQREQVEAATIELYDYIFRALSADLTSKQGVAFAFVARLLLTIPGATIHTLRELMEDQSPSIDKSPFHDAILQLDTTARAFFEAHFFTRAFVDTKRQIARRIYDFIRNKTFERMFSSPLNKLDMFEAMNSGAIVLVNTSKALLKSAASALFGRFMIALTLRAAFERVAIPPEHRRPAFLIVDEAADYFDSNVDALLTQVRKFKLGLIFAHQYLDQLDGPLRASFAANTAIKFAGGVSDKDARALAPDMHCRPEFITAQRKHDRHTTFAAFVRNLTPTALPLSVPFGTLDRLPQMTPAARLALRERNRQRYAADPGATGSPQRTTAAEPRTVAHEDHNWISGTRAR